MKYKLLYIYVRAISEYDDNSYTCCPIIIDERKKLLKEKVIKEMSEMIIRDINNEISEAEINISSTSIEVNDNPVYKITPRKILKSFTSEDDSQEFWIREEIVEVDLPYLKYDKSDAYEELKEKMILNRRTKEIIEKFKVKDYMYAISYVFYQDYDYRENDDNYYGYRAISKNLKELILEGDKDFSNIATDFLKEMYGEEATFENDYTSKKNCILNYNDKAQVEEELKKSSEICYKNAQNDNGAFCGLVIQKVPIISNTK